jgi:hypothetical protein
MSLYATLRPEDFAYLKEDRLRFTSALQVPDKYGKMVRVGADVQPVQRQIMADLMGPAELIWYNKSRQLRASSTVLAWVFTELYWTEDPIAAILATNYDSTNEELWGRLRGYYDGLPQCMQRGLEKHNGRLMKFGASGARIKCLSSRSPAGARSGTNQITIADEVAYWYNPTQLWADLASTQVDAASTRTVGLSTPNGPGGLHHEKFMAAREAMRRGDAKVIARFFEWWKQGEYAMPPPPGWEPTQEEYAYGELYRLRPDQLYWRHEKIYGAKGIGLAQFRREFPSTEEEGFLNFGGAWFDLELLSAIEAVLLSRRRAEGELRIYRRPVVGRSYAIGVDPSLCSGGDDACAQVLDDEGEQVAVLSRNTGGVEPFADAVGELAAAYNNARVLCEWNPQGGGNIVIGRLRDLGVRLWQADPKPGAKPGTEPRHWVTSHGNKEAAYSHARQMVNGNVWTLNDLSTVQQMQHIRHEDGTIEGRDGCKDDESMALVLAGWNLRTMPKSLADPKPDWRPKRQVERVDPWGATRR